MMVSKQKKKDKYKVVAEKSIYEAKYKKYDNLYRKLDTKKGEDIDRLAISREKRTRDLCNL